MEKIRNSKILRIDTEEDMKKLVKRDEEAWKNGSHKSMKEVCQHWKERYGIEIL